MERNTMRVPDVSVRAAGPFAMRIANQCGRPRPDAADFAPTDIIRLARIVERIERDGA
ncbi:hypothetical protein [Burkholderia sp. AU32262]|uniref:hypothetical protein n=1 Tax=Burkholderia sp. AU32262 TaxID=2879630 RepID=UPI001CF25B51|nr:hypothetical protein [Burkholderia sp. AU32262]MCA8242235.1 hypothetical protein [Burkholderia sp. AU32262]